MIIKTCKLKYRSSKLKMKQWKHRYNNWVQRRVHGQGSSKIWKRGYIRSKNSITPYCKKWIVHLKLKIHLANRKKIKSIQLSLIPSLIVSKMLLTLWNKDLSKRKVKSYVCMIFAKPLKTRIKDSSSKLTVNMAISKIWRSKCRNRMRRVCFWGKE